MVGEAAQEVIAHRHSDGARRWNGSQTRREGGRLGKGVILGGKVALPRRATAGRPYADVTSCSRIARGDLAHEVPGKRAPPEEALAGGGGLLCLRRGR